MLCFFFWTNNGPSFKWEALFDIIQGHSLKKVCDSMRHVSEESVPWERTIGRALGDFRALRRYDSQCSPALSPCNTGNVGGGRRSVSERRGEEGRSRVIYLLEKSPIGCSGSLSQRR